MSKSKSKVANGDWGMEKFYIVYLGNGKTSGELVTIPDIATYIEDNMEVGVGKVTIKLHKRRSDAFKLKELESEREHLELRLNLIAKREAEIKSFIANNPKDSAEEAGSPEAM